MPRGPYGEIVGTTGTLDALSDKAKNYGTKVVAPRNPKLLKGEQKAEKMMPSQYLFYTKMTTEQKLANTKDMRVPRMIELLDMGDTSLQKGFRVGMDEPMLLPFPSEIHFQQFEPFQMYEVELLLRNNDKIPRLVKVTQADSPYFKIISPLDVATKVGPGLPTVFKIQFTPDEKRDYMHELVCVTEREKFIVSVKAIGARAILDFPDKVNFEENPVKSTASKTLLVRNVGNREAKFSLATEKPFTVTPLHGTVAVNDSMQVTVDFTPTYDGDVSRDMALRYDTGEELFMQLYGIARNANVRLDKNSIHVENTFISMANVRHVTIHNRTDVMAHFRWTQFATQEEEDMQRLGLTEELMQEEDSEERKFLEECNVDPSLRDKLAILSRTFSNRRAHVETDKMLFNDEVVKIEPCEGEIWPNSSLELQVIFKPSEAKLYSRTAFCDITGREARLPLRITGTGMGPRVQLDMDSLEIGNVFINSTHTYEVVLANKGDIDAIYSLVPPTSIFGPKFTFNPSEAIVMPGGHQAVSVTFCSPVLGNFQEDFFFQVDGAPEKLKLTISGCVIGPTFHFDKPMLKFGTVSYGFVSTETVTLVNTALVPMTFTLRVLGDGISESMASLADMESNRSEAGSTQPLKEFEITPVTGAIAAQSEMKIQVDLLSTTLKKYDTCLAVDVQGVGDNILSLPISARCIVPNIQVVMPVLEYGRCFLRYPVERHVMLQNDTDLPASYELLPTMASDTDKMTYESSKPKGIIDPHSVFHLPLAVRAMQTEEQETIGQIAILGNSDAPLSVQLMCVGEGPVVHVRPLSLNWGQTPVLTDIMHTVHLSNESLIPAKFTAHMVRASSNFRVEPQEGEIPPEGQLELKVTANVDDTVRFQDKLQINFLEGHSRTIPLEAYGFGNTIDSEPKLQPYMHLGAHFSASPLRKTFKLTNRGRRMQQLVFQTDGFPLVKRKSDQTFNPKDMRSKMAGPPVPVPEPVFSIMPQRVELKPGESADVTLEGHSEGPQEVKERLLCHAIIGRAGGKELVMKIDVTCDFITPLLEFSSQTMFFRVDKTPEDELREQQSFLEVRNVASLPLTCLMKLPYPFGLLNKERQNVQEMELCLQQGEKHVLTVTFDPAYKNDLHIRTVDEVLEVAYQEHPHVDKIALRGEVYFPNLDFEKKEVDFGCILNDTEVTRYIYMTNNSPMEVKYSWSFLIGDDPETMFRRRPRPLPTVEVATERYERIPSDRPPVDGDQVEVQILDVDRERAEQIMDGTPRVEQQPTQPEMEQKGEETAEKKEGEEAAPEPEKTDVEKEPKLTEPSVPTEGDTVTAPVSGGVTPRAPEGKADEASQPHPDVPPLGRLGSVTPGPRPGTASRPLPESVNPALQEILERDIGPSPIRIEEVFDILPLYGTLKPGQSEQITLTFYGHADIGSKARAVCDVVGGPRYEVNLKGEASLVDYSFDTLDVDFGKQLYDHVGTAQITLHNTGKVGFNFVAVGVDPALAEKPLPGEPVMVPHSGYIPAESEQTLQIKFLPGKPEVFRKTFKIQVAHFEPDEVNLFGEGVFPRISLDLPRYSDADGQYSGLLARAKEKLQQTARGTQAAQQTTQRADGKWIQEAFTTEMESQLEAERLVVADFADKIQTQERNKVDILSLDQGPRGTDTKPNTGRPSTRSVTSKDSSRKLKAKDNKKKPKPVLPDYNLDFGHVVLGTVRTHVVRATNTGHFPCSFQLDRGEIFTQGFNVELDHVRKLPGAPDHETVDFVVSFDPRGANLGLGPVEANIPVHIINGPSLNIRLKADVTMPDMEISSDSLDFEEVKCGECRVITVQLHNHRHVECHWDSSPLDKTDKKTGHMTLRELRRKRQEADKVRTRHFEMMPPSGSLLPGQRLNVQVKFMPTEEKAYEIRLPIRLANSSQRILLMCKGQGLEPRLEFEHSLVEFGPVLPHSAGDEQDIIVRNPCKFPIEFYSLEFDKQYLNEEKILRLMRGYDEARTLLLPPRGTNEKLPDELIKYFDEQVRKLEEEERARRAAEEAAAQTARETEQGPDDMMSTTDGATTERGEKESEKKSEKGSRVKDGATTERDDESALEATPGLVVTVPSPAPSNKEEDENMEHKLEQLAARSKSSSAGVGELEITPVSAAIARHLGIDLSSEGKAARNRRGIAVVVHGPPLSGKTPAAVMMAKRYQAALLSIDTVVMDAISSGNTHAGLQAREMCSEAARKRAEEIKSLEAEGIDVSGDPRKGGLSMEAVAAHTQGQGVGLAHAPSQMTGKKTSLLSEEGKGAKGRKDPKGQAASTVEGGSQVDSSTQEGSSVQHARRKSAMKGGHSHQIPTISVEQVIVATRLLVAV